MIPFPQAWFEIVLQGWEYLENNTMGKAGIDLGLQEA